MEKVLIRRMKHKILGNIEYYLDVTFHEEFENIEMYGITVVNDGETKSVENVDFDKTRIIEFINCLAEAYVTTETLTDLCEDYVEMLTDRS